MNFNLFKRTESVPTPDIINKLQKKAADALADFDNARAQHARAALVVEEDPDNGAAALATARKAVSKAEERYIDATAALDAARARHEAAEREAVTQARGARWDAAERASVDYLESGRRVASLTKQLGEAYVDHVRTNADFRAALPETARPDLQEAAFTVDAIQMATRIALKRSGVDWTFQYVGDIRELPDFESSQAENVAALLAVRESEGGAL